MAKTRKISRRKALKKIRKTRGGRHTDQNKYTYLIMKYGGIPQPWTNEHQKNLNRAMLRKNLMANTTKGLYLIRKHRPQINQGMIDIYDNSTWGNLGIEAEQYFLHHHIFDQIKEFRNFSCTEEPFTVKALHREPQVQEELAENIQTLDAMIKKEKQSMFGSLKLRGDRKAGKKPTLEFLQELLTNGTATRTECELGQIAVRLNELNHYDKE